MKMECEGNKLSVRGDNVVGGSIRNTRRGQC